MQALSYKVSPSRRFEATQHSNSIEIDGFSGYELQIEDAKLSSANSNPKKLVLNIGLDGALTLVLQSTKGDLKEGRIEELKQMLPSGFDYYFETEASKIIRGTRGKYYHFKNQKSGEFISFAESGSGGRPYKIALGSLSERNSPIRTVLENLPSEAFTKVMLHPLLPSHIVENRQPIKAALDILLKEQFVKLVSNAGKSEQYVKTSKAFPPFSKQKEIVEK